MAHEFTPATGAVKCANGLWDRIARPDTLEAKKLAGKAGYSTQASEGYAVWRLADRRRGEKAQNGPVEAKAAPTTGKHSKATHAKPETPKATPTASTPADTVIARVEILVHANGRIEIIPHA